MHQVPLITFSSIYKITTGNRETFTEALWMRMQDMSKELIERNTDEIHIPTFIFNGDATGFNAGNSNFRIISSS